MRFALVVAALWLAACGQSSSPDAVRIALNWFPEPEHGGYFRRRRRRPLVDILSGGPGVPVVPRVASREVDFGVVNADDGWRHAPPACRSSPCSPRSIGARGA
jgi:NitT/TauT family transport system substrate-binding protein